MAALPGTGFDWANGGGLGAPAAATAAQPAYILYLDLQDKRPHVQRFSLEAVGIVTSNEALRELTRIEHVQQLPNLPAWLQGSPDPNAPAPTPTLYVLGPNPQIYQGQDCVSVLANNSEALSHHARRVGSYGAPSAGAGEASLVSGRGRGFVLEHGPIRDDPARFQGTERGNWQSHLQQMIQARESTNEKQKRQWESASASVASGGAQVAQGGGGGVYAQQQQVATMLQQYQQRQQEAQQGFYGAHAPPPPQVPPQMMMAGGGGGGGGYGQVPQPPYGTPFGFGGGGGFAPPQQQQQQPYQQNQINMPPMPGINFGNSGGAGMMMPSAFGGGAGAWPAAPPQQQQQPFFSGGVGLGGAFGMGGGAGGVPPPGF